MYEFNFLEYKDQEVFADEPHQSTKLFHKFKNDLSFMIEHIPLRELNFCGKRVIGYLITSYANYIGRYSTHMLNNKSMAKIHFSLVIGMPNYGSHVANECIHQFGPCLPSTVNDSKEDEYELITQVFALTFGDNISSNIKTLSTEFGSAYLLAHSVERFLSHRKIIPQITDMYLNHLAPRGYIKYVKAGLFDLYERTIPLLRNSKLLQNDSQIYIPYNAGNIYSLHKWWPQSNKYMSVTFSKTKSRNRWYNACQ